jgi:hypothetical protein
MNEKSHCMRVSVEFINSPQSGTVGRFGHSTAMEICSESRTLVSEHLTLLVVVSFAERALAV